MRYRELTESLDDLHDHLQRNTALYDTPFDDADDADTAQLLKSKALLPSNTWLVHFTMNADAIAQTGFTIGMRDPKRLGTTVLVANDHPDKTAGGFNFAYIANAASASNTADPKIRTYGDEAVMFRSAGLHVWHAFDDEDQVIFWGPDVAPEKIVVLKAVEDGRWEVISRDGRVQVQGTFQRCVLWVVAAV